MSSKKGTSKAKAEAEAETEAETEAKAKAEAKAEAELKKQLHKILATRGMTSINDKTMNEILAMFENPKFWEQQIVVDGPTELRLIHYFILMKNENKSDLPFKRLNTIIDAYLEKTRMVKGEDSVKDVLARVTVHGENALLLAVQEDYPYMIYRLCRLGTDLNTRNISDQNIEQYIGMKDPAIRELYALLIDSKSNIYVTEEVVDILKGTPIITPRKAQELINKIEEHRATIMDQRRRELARIVEAARAARAEEKASSSSKGGKRKNRKTKKYHRKKRSFSYKKYF
jgi:hypothetical protein